MRCLITGGAGFIGTNLIKKLLEKDYDVDSFDNYSTGYKENEQDGCNYLDIDIAQCDVGGSNVFYKKSGGWESIEKPDVIFHLAALARIQPSIKNPNIMECLTVLMPGLNLVVKNYVDCIVKYMI
jgi:UDP-glucose 4-epimerase